MWPEPLKASIVAAAILAGSWLVWLGLGAAPASAPAIAPPPISTVHSVTPVTRLPIPTSPPFVSIIQKTPKGWNWTRYDLPSGCAPELTLSRLCFEPTPASGAYGPEYVGTGR